MARILVIDDDDQVRGMLRQMLERAGYEVIEAPDGEEGMRLYREAPSDLVIMDLIMPEKEGIETIMELRQRKPGLKIIAMSGGGRVGNTQYLHLAKSLGADNVMPKPFTMDEVQDLVSRTMAQA